METAAAYHMQKLLQGVYHFLKLGGNNQTLPPRFCHNMANSIMHYIDLNNSPAQLQDMKDKCKNLTDTYFLNLTNEFKQTWLNQSDRALTKLRAMQLYEQDIIDAYNKAETNLITKLGRKVKPSLNFMWGVLPNLLPAKKSYRDTVKSGETQADNPRPQHGDRDRQHRHHEHHRGHTERSHQHRDTNEIRRQEYRQEHHHQHQRDGTRQHPYRRYNQHYDPTQHREQPRRDIGRRRPYPESLHRERYRPARHEDPLPQREQPRRDDGRRRPHPESRHSERHRPTRHENNNYYNPLPQRVRNENRKRRTMEDRPAPPNKTRQQEEESNEEGQFYKYTKFQTYLNKINVQNKVHLKDDLFKPGLEPLNAQGQEDPLSNFYSTKIPFLGMNFRSTEHLYQFLKAVYCKDTKIADKILWERSAANVKKFGNQLNQKFPEKIKEWDIIKINIMKDLINLKAKVCTTFKNKLIYSYPRPITHNIPDKFWGSYHLNKDRRSQGENHFGKILMQVRQELITEWDLEIARAISRNQREATPQITTDTESQASETLGNLIALARDTPDNQPEEIIETQTNQPTVSTQDTQIDDRLELSQEVPDTISQAESTTRSASLPPTLKSTPTSRIIGPQSQTHTANNSNKKKNWQLPQFTEQIVVIGDSNVKNMTHAPADIKSIEIHSYPGAKPMHFTTMFKTNQFSHNTKKVILSVGINNRANQKKTNDEQLAKMMSAYSKWLPNTKKAITHIQFDRTKLDICEGIMIDKMNTTLRELCQKHNIAFLPPVPEEEFETKQHDKDHIHWTKDTADRILCHWTLNWLRPPRTVQPRWST